MRVPPCAWVMGHNGQLPSKENVWRNFLQEVTHNHPEGIEEQWPQRMQSICAVISSVVIILRRLKDSEGTYREKYGYDLSQTLDEIRPTYRFNETCRDTVPQAIVAPLESTDFEKMIRNAISWWGQRHSCCNHRKYRRGSLWILSG